MSKTFLRHPARGPCCIWVERHELKMQFWNEERPRSRPQISPAAATQTFERTVRDAVAQGCAPIDQGTYDLAREVGARGPDALDRAWFFIGHRVAQGFEQVIVDCVDTQASMPLSILLADPRIGGTKTLKVRRWRQTPEGADDYGVWFDALIQHAPPLTVLELDTLSSVQTARRNQSGDVAALIEAIPSLQSLHLCATPAWSKPVAAPALQSLHIEAAWPADASSLASLLGSEMKQLNALHIHPGDERALTVNEVFAFLDRAQRPIDQLTLFNFDADDQIFKRFSTHAALPGLRELTLIFSTPPAPSSLLPVATSYAHLERFGLHADSVDEHVEAALPNVESLA